MRMKASEMAISKLEFINGGDSRGNLRSMYVRCILVTLRLPSA
jgi:hypothetical protein